MALSEAKLNTYRQTYIHASYVPAVVFQKQIDMWWRLDDCTQPNPPLSRSPFLQRIGVIRISCFE